ncbi:MAG: hypothetical protein GY835_01785 [bacterium]|nr:hypothetical protein [bacterium]
MPLPAIRSLFALIMLAVAGQALGCSSFAVYGDEPLYGMNFDYSSETPIRFVIETHGNRRVFHLTFRNNGHFVPTCGMNSDGLFGANQLVPRKFDNEIPSDPRHEYIWQLYRRALMGLTTVDEIRQHLATWRLLQDPKLGMHLLLADPGGDAMIAEAGEQRNELIDIDGEYIVMTNFLHQENRGADCDSVNGDGAGRFGKICKALAGNGDRIDYERGFAILREASNTSRKFPTRCSLIFLPRRGEIYLALERDFGNIWKISLAAGTLETSGQGEQRKMPLNATGVLAADLLAFSPDTGRSQ